MKNALLLLPVVILLGCSSSSPPKQVNDSWDRFKRVYVGMSRTEVLQKIGFPGAYTTNAAQGTAFETWLVGELPGHSAELDISYASDGRVRSIERHRYHTRRPNNPGAAY